MKPSVVVHGPHGCGKTIASHRIAAHFGLTKIVEVEGSPVRKIKPDGVLYLTSCPERAATIGVKIVPFSQVMKDIIHLERVRVRGVLT